MRRIGEKPHGERAPLPERTKEVVGIPADDNVDNQAKVLLKLYIAGQNSRSRQARRALDELCASSGYNLEVEVIDIVERPQLAEDEKILATPVVVRELPPPVRRIIGDLSDFHSVLVGLDLHHDAGNAGGPA